MGVGGSAGREAELQAAAREARDRGRYIDRFRRGNPGYGAAVGRAPSMPLRLPPTPSVTSHFASPSEQHEVCNMCSCWYSSWHVVVLEYVLRQ